MDTNSNELEELIQELRKMIKESEFALTPRTDREFLLKFLRMKKYSLDNAFRTIKNYYDNIERNLDIVTGIRPSEFEIVFTDGPFKSLKNRYKGRRVGIMHIRKWKPKQMPINHIQATAYFLFENMGLEIETQENGFVAILDYKDLSFEHFRQLSLKEIKRVMYTLEGIPVRITEIHVVHPPPLFWALFKIVSRFLKEKLRKRLHIHSNLESLHKFIDQSICPESIGGKLSDEEAHDIAFIDEILRKDIYVEDMWNGDRIREED